MLIKKQCNYPVQDKMAQRACFPQPFYRPRLSQSAGHLHPLGPVPVRDDDALGQRIERENSVPTEVGQSCRHPDRPIS